MKDYLLSKIYSFSFFLEMIISMILSAIIVVLSLKLAFVSFDMIFIQNQEEAFNNILQGAMNLAVGVELVKLLCKHTPATIVEVLMFAITRQMVAEHSSVMATLTSVVCVAILFATRKYLFIAHDDVTKVTLRGSQSVKMANVLAKVHIPKEDGATLREVIEKHLEQEDRELAVGTCVDYDNFALCIASIHDGRITRVDVLKTN